MSFSDLQSLTKIVNIVQILAIIFIVLGGLLQASRFFLDKKVDEFRMENQKKKIQESEKFIMELQMQLREKEGQINQVQEFPKEQPVEEELIGEEPTPSYELDKPPGAVRVIPQDQLDNLIAKLSERKGEVIEITCVLGDQESLAFATQLKSVFELANWTVEGINQAAYAKPNEGLFLVLNDESIYPKAEFLFELFNSIGFQSVGKIDEDQERDLSIVVGIQEKK